MHKTRLVARIAVIVLSAATTVGLDTSSASADTVDRVNAYSPGGAVVAAARYTYFSGTAASEWCVKAVSSGHAVSYLRYPDGHTLAIDEWGGDNDWDCTCPPGANGKTLKMSVDYWLANGTRYAYSDVITFVG